MKLREAQDMAVDILKMLDVELDNPKWNLLTGFLYGRFNTDQPTGLAHRCQSIGAHGQCAHSEGHPGPHQTLDGRMFP